MPQKTIEDYLGKKIKVTYKAFEGEDYYDVAKVLNTDKSVLMIRASQTTEPFSVTQNWFFEENAIGKKVEIVKE